MITKKMFTIFLILLLPVLLIGCEQEENLEAKDPEPNNSPVDIRGYFPGYINLEYDFAGEGMEYAPFQRKIMYVNEDNGLMQLHDITTGTTVVNIFQITGEQIALIFQQGEFYGDDNLLEQIDDLELQEERVILRRPLETGENWVSGGQKREIVAVDQSLTTIFGTFQDVIKVKVENIDEDGNFTNYEYYAKNMGLVKRLSVMGEEEYQVTSELQALNTQKEE